MPDSFNIQPPFFGPTHPLYPHLLQLVRVTATTVPGPTGWTSASIQAADLYVSVTQQLRTDNLLPRDREPCLALDVNGWGLIPGYYLGRLAGAWTGLPVYEVGRLPDNLAGLTPAQMAVLTADLTEAQLNALYNLNACQLQTLVNVNTSSSFPSPVDVPNMQKITTLTPTEVAKLIGDLSTPQLNLLLPKLSIPQLQLLVDPLTPDQVTELVQLLTPDQIAQLVDGSTPLTPANLQTLLYYFTPPQIFALINAQTPAQLQNLFGQLTVPQLQNLAKYDPATIINLIVQPLGNWLPLLGLMPQPPAPIIGNQQGLPGVPVIVGAPSSTPVNMQGYAPIVANQAGQLYSYTNGAWNQVGAGGGGGASNALTHYTGTTTNTFATVFDVTNGNGLHGSFAVDNTGLVNGLTTRLTVTDMFGNTSQTTHPVSAASLFGFVLEQTTLGTPPFKEAKLEIEDTVGGAHTTYSIYLSLVG